MSDLRFLFILGQSLHFARLAVTAPCPVYDGCSLFSLRCLFIVGFTVAIARRVCGVDGVPCQVYSQCSSASLRLLYLAVSMVGVLIGSTVANPRRFYVPCTLLYLVWSSVAVDIKGVYCFKLYILLCNLHLIVLPTTFCSLL